MEDKKELETAFVVTVYTDGTFAASMELPDEKLEVKRQATVADVQSICSGLLKEIEQSQLTDRIIVSLLSVLQGAAQASPADLVKDKLKERGIDPESISTTE